MSERLVPLTEYTSQNIQVLVLWVPTEDTGAQTKLFEPVVLAGNGSAHGSTNIKPGILSTGKITYI